jgi:L-iditol 2-dehydrogenase
MIVPPNKVFALPSTLVPEKAALVEPIACCIRSVRSASPKPGDTALVFGAGTMGLIHTVLLSLAGCRVFVFDDDAKARRRAEDAGAHGVGGLFETTSSCSAVARVGKWGADAVFCIRGGAKAIEYGVGLAARGARIVLYQSIADDAQLTLSANDIHYREIKLVGSIAQSASDFASAADLVTTYSSRFDCLELETFGAVDAQAAFDRSIGAAVNRVLIDFEALPPA